MGKEEDLDVGVDWGNLSIGKKTARLGFKIDKGKIKRGQVDAYFIDSRLIVTLILDDTAKDDTEGQKKLVDTEVKVNAVADVKGYSTNLTGYSGGLTFSKEDANLNKLMEFIGRGGRMIAKRSGDAGGE